MKEKTHKVSQGLPPGRHPLTQVTLLYHQCINWGMGPQDLSLPPILVTQGYEMILMT